MRKQYIFTSVIPEIRKQDKQTKASANFRGGRKTYLYHKKLTPASPKCRFEQNLVLPHPLFRTDKVTTIEIL